jgi:ABC-type sugar transport system ATPase subunit
MQFLQVSSIRKQLSPSFTLGSIQFSQPQGKKISITGETGSGKSSLLRIIAGLLQPDAGNVFFEGSRVPGPDEKLLPGHPDIAYLSQDHELRNNYRMGELLEYANKIPADQALALYRLCRIDHLLQRKNDQLSGGEKQRVALARLLVGSPKLLLLDEPFSNLDLIHKNILKGVIGDIAERLQITCMLTSHDPTDTLSWADEILVMRHGNWCNRQRRQRSIPNRLMNMWPGSSATTACSIMTRQLYSACRCHPGKNCCCARKISGSAKRKVLKLK